VGIRISASRMAPADSANALAIWLSTAAVGLWQSALDLTERRPFGQLPHRYLRRLALRADEACRCLKW
jgi:hypothetical protein